ncbi:MAG: YesL family protein [Lachnospiraceae bacterium]
MSAVFNSDNPFFNFMTKLGDIMLASVLWVLCCIPIVTAGASTVALYYTVTKSVRKEQGYVSKEFFHSFKQNLKQGILVFLILGGLAALFSFDAYFMKESGMMQGKSAKIFTIVYYAFLVIDLMIAVYVFPYLARFANTVKATIINAVLMAVAHFPKTILCMVIVVAGGVVLRFIPIFVFIVPGGVAFLLSVILEKVFYSHMTDEQKKEEDLQRVGY